MPVAHHQCDNRKCLRTLPDVLGGEVGAHRSYLRTTTIEEKGWLSERFSRGAVMYFLKVAREEAKKQHKGKCRSVGCPGSIGVSCGWRHLHPECGGEPRRGCKLGQPQGGEDLSVCKREPEGQEPVRRTELRPDLSLERSHLRALPEKEPGWSNCLLWDWGPASSSISCLGPQ